MGAAAKNLTDETAAGRSESVRINSAHSILWYLEKNTSAKYPEWRSAIITFLFQLFELANKNYGIDIDIKKVDGLDISYDGQLICFLHVRRQHLLLHLNGDCLLYSHRTTKSFRTPHKGSWPKMFKLTAAEELDALVGFVSSLKVIKPKDYYASRTIPAKVKEIVWDRDKGRCRRCTSQENLHFDHDVPYSKGGSSDDPKNIQILCGDCNLKKGNRRFF